MRTVAVEARTSTAMAAGENNIGRFAMHTRIVKWATADEGMAMLCRQCAH